MIKLIFSAIVGLILYSDVDVTNAQDVTARSEFLLLDAIKEQYKLDNEIREQQWNGLKYKWATTLNEVEQFVNTNARHTQEDIENSHAKIDRLLKDTKLSLEKSENILHTNNLLLEGLGISPSSANEPESLTVTRNQLNSIRFFLENQVKEMDQLITNFESLKLALSQLRRRQFKTIVTTRTALPFLPSTVITAVKTINSRFAELYISMDRWLKEHVDTPQLGKATVIIVFTLFISYFLGKFINDKFGRDPAVHDPSHSRRLTAALAEGISIGLIPVSIIGTFYFFINSSYNIESDQFYKIVNVVLRQLIVLSIFSTLCIAFLSPRYPQWRLTTLNSDSSSKLGNALIYLIIVFVVGNITISLIDVDVDGIVNFNDAESRTVSFLGTIFNFLKSFGLIYLCRSAIWQPDRNYDNEHESTAMDSLLNLVRVVIVILSIVSIIASLTGQVYLGGYITFGIFITLIVFGLSYIISKTAHDLVSYFVKQKWLRKNLRLRIITLQNIKFWANFIIDPIVFGFALLIVMPMWGVPVDRLFQWLKFAFEGFNIGELRISLKGILLSIIVFVVIMRLTRFTQKFVKQNILSQSTQSIASQHSTLTSINYLGVMIALGASIAALGIDFKTVAVILGALSVGIGFGLRNIASNFVAGILLLFEKPIKVGDWIQIGEHEGFVKQLKFRSTELETFQQASVIIPNADLISLPVINMTFADQQGRIEIPVSVAYHSDPALVHSLLIDLANKHSDVLDDPPPQALFMNFGESSLDFELRCFTNNVISKVIIASELRFEIEKTLRDSGIEIPFPQRVVHIKKQTEPVI